VQIKRAAADISKFEDLSSSVLVLLGKLGDIVESTNNKHDDADEGIEEEVRPLCWRCCCGSIRGAGGCADVSVDVCVF
jgi:hypothetical protein